MIMEMEPLRQISHYIWLYMYFLFNSEYYKKDVLKVKIWDLIPLNQFVFNISVCYMEFKTHVLLINHQQN